MAIFLRLPLLVIIVLFPFTNTVFSQSWKWVKNPQCNKKNQSKDITISPGTTGKIFSGGVFNNDTLFWDGIALSSANQDSLKAMDCYILALKNDSMIDWMKRMGGKGADYLSAMDADSAGNVYSTGYFDAEFYAGTDTLINSSPASPKVDIFIAKHDSIGNLKWLKGPRGVLNEQGEDVHVCAGGVLVSGNFRDTCRFDAILVTKTDWDNNFFFAKYSPAGIAQWARASYGKYVALSNNQKSHIQSDLAGNIYVSGHFNDSIGFGNKTVYGKGGNDIFLARFDPIGKIQWIKNLGGYNNDVCSDIHLFQDSILLISGNTTDTFWFGNQSFFNNAGQSAFLGRLNTSGNSVQFDFFNSGSSTYSGQITTDKSDNIYLSSNFTDSVSFMDSSFVSSNVNGCLVLKISEGSGVLWGKVVSGKDSVSVVQTGNLIADSLGNIFTAGGYTNENYFDSIIPDTVNRLNSFIAKLSCYVSPPSLIFSNNKICPVDTIPLTATTSSWNSILWSNNETSDTIYVNAEGPYSVVSVDENGCRSMADSVEIVHFVPAENPVLLQKCDTIFTNDYFTAGQWHWNDSTLLSDSLNFIKAIQDGNYFLAASDSNGCSIPSDTIFFVSPPPFININRKCDSLWVADYYTNYSWFFVATLLSDDTSNYIIADTNGSYHVVVEDTNGCTIYSQGFNYIASDTLLKIFRVCDQFYVNLGYDNYTWFYNGSVLSSDTTEHIFANDNGQYSLIVTDTVGCLIPTDTISYVAPDSSVTFNRKCDSLWIPEVYFRYRWFYNGSFKDADSLNYFLATENGYYYLNVTDTNYCIIPSDTITYIAPPPFISLTRICDSLMVPNIYISYTWFFNGDTLVTDTLNYIVAAANGTYSLLVADSFGCLINSDAYPYSKVVLGAIDRLCDTLSVPDIYQGYQWFYNGMALPGDTFNSTVAAINGNYSLTVIDNIGCPVPSQTISLVKPPTLISLSKSCDTLSVPAIYPYYAWLLNGLPYANYYNSIIATVEIYN